MMMINDKPEFWLSGDIENIPALLQPVAHALLQTQREIELFTQGFKDELLWLKPAGRASVGFHLQHISGVLDRMVTYAKGDMLTEKQLDDLSDEGQPFLGIRLSELVQKLNRRLEQTIEYLKIVDENSLTDIRTVGRKKLPSTVIGILFHAAEHAQRHVGQLLVTVSVVQNGPYQNPNF